MGRKGLTWTKAEKSLLCKYTSVAREYGESLIATFETVSRRLNRPESTIGMYYYNVIRRDDDFSEEEVFRKLTEEERESILDEIRGRKRARQRKPWTDEETRIIEQVVKERLEKGEKLQDIWEYLHKEKMPNRTVGAITRQYYANIRQADEPNVDEPNVTEKREPDSPMLSNGVVPEELQPIISKLHAYNQLSQENERLKREIVLLRESLEEMKKQYEDAELLFNMFTNMASISQIMGLGDFKQQMRTQLDKWGNVVKISFEKIS